ncbi:hypothetical protein EC396_09045 [Lutibacter sp. HS1-25]|uniref:hypothetical protein n=1 Tax=Lutibacter sp. HS1-25 TaxID=2485000 RepID=UPI001011A18E|nr:hypothetical protein [Lutibacter sp. HS1-25]RXP54521.1 hypothetical protein EC396_09045 [Lutibacter sp. HS1-25]
MKTLKIIFFILGLATFNSIQASTLTASNQAQHIILLQKLQTALAYAENNPEDCGCKLKEYVAEYLELFPPNVVILANIQTYTPEQIKNAAGTACAYLEASLREGFNASKFKEKIATQIGVNPNNEDINSILSDFLNQNKNKMICAKDPKSNTSRSMHFYKYAILNGIIDLYDEILFDDEEFEIDFNAVEIVDGKPETLLDYIDKRITTGTGIANTLKGVRIDVVDLGGKTGQQLIDSGAFIMK